MHSSDTALRLVTAPLGKLSSYDVASRHVERIVASSDDLAKRVLRFETSRGDIGVRLDSSLQVADGDILFADDTLVIAIEIAPDDVLVCKPGSIAQALAVAHALGNRHVPMQVDGETLVVRYDRLVEELFIAQNVSFARERRKLGSAFRHAHAPHGHA